jgi:perosamine synthetase
MIPIGKPILGEEERQAVQRVLESGMLAQGKVVAEFERQFAAYIGTKHAIAVGNGTQALHVAYMAIGLGKGGEAVVPDLTFAATATPLLHIGAKPVFADIEPIYFSLDPASAKKLAGKKVKAIVPVHLYGHPADVAPLRELADSLGARLVEDACQAHGALYKGRKAGSLGDIACFSFYPTKNMTTGEGGMLTTDDAELDAACRLLRDHGQSKQYTHTHLGHNFRMTDVAAAMGIEQLKKLDAANEARRANAAIYDGALAGIVGTPREAPWARHVYHQYTLRVPKNRDKLAEFLSKNGVGTRVYYPMPLSAQPIFSGARSGKNPEAARAASEVLSIPVHPAVGRADAERIAALVGQWAKGQ